MSNPQWLGRRIIVAGGTAGFGLVLARHLTRFGAHVLIVGRSATGIQRAFESCEQAGDKTDTMRGISADLSRAGEGNRVAGEALRLLGGIDDLFFCVGRSGRAAMLETSPATLQEYLDANLLTAVEMTQAVSDDVALSSGHLVYMGSLAGKIVMPYMGPYSVGKSALAAYVESIRLELEGRGAHVLLVSPGPIGRSPFDPVVDRAHTRYIDEAKAAGLPEEAAVPGGTTSLSPIDPERLVGRVLDACKLRIPELIVPRKVSFLAGIIEWFPTTGRRVLAWATKRR